jgi:HNH endonuclease/AP2 domain
MKCIELTRGYVAIVDDEDFEYLAQWRWHARTQRHGVYAARSVNFRKEDGKHSCITLYMAVAIMNPPQGMVVDHKSGMTLDNRRSNLRIATRKENCRNRKIQKTSKIGKKGVCIKPRLRSRPFVARIVKDGKRVHLGCFATAEEAHAAYCSAAKEIHGEFARFN